MPASVIILLRPISPVFMSSAIGSEISSCIFFVGFAAPGATVDTVLGAFANCALCPCTNSALGNWSAKIIAREAYEIADAMMEARK